MASDKTTPLAPTPRTLRRDTTMKPIPTITAVAFLLVLTVAVLLMRNQQRHDQDRSSSNNNNQHVVVETATSLAEVASSSSAAPLSSATHHRRLLELPWWLPFFTARSDNNNNNKSGWKRKTAASKTPARLFLQSGRVHATMAPIFVVGLPKSGSLSIHRYFECNYLASTHYCCTGPGSPHLPLQSETEREEAAIHEEGVVFGGGEMKTSQKRKGKNKRQLQRKSVTKLLGRIRNHLHAPAPPREEFPCNSDNEEQPCGACVWQNLRHDLPALEGCMDVKQQVYVYSQLDVESGDPFSWFLPQHFALPLLHESYPDSIWILNRRESAERWATNVLHWYSIANRLLNAFGIPYWSEYPNGTNTYPDRAPSQKELFDELEKAIHRTEKKEEHERRKRALAQIYDAHLQKVRDFVQEHGGSHQLIEINVDDPVETQQTLFHAFPGFEADCWSFDSKAADNDWKDFTLKL